MYVEQVVAATNGDIAELPWALKVFVGATVKYLGACGRGPCKHSGPAGSAGLLLVLCRCLHRRSCGSGDCDIAVVLLPCAGTTLQCLPVRCRGAGNGNSDIALVLQLLASATLKYLRVR